MRKRSLTRREAGESLAAREEGVAAETLEEEIWKEETLEEETPEKIGRNVGEENGKSGILTAAAAEEKEKRDIRIANALEEEMLNTLILIAVRREAAKAERRFWMISP